MATLMLILMMVTVLSMNEGPWVNTIQEWAISIVLVSLFFIGFLLFLPSLHHLGAIEKEFKIDRTTDQRTMALTLERVLARDGKCEVKMTSPFRTIEDTEPAGNPRPTVHYTVLDAVSKEVLLELWFYTEEGRVDVLVPRAHVDIIPRIEGALMNLN